MKCDYCRHTAQPEAGISIGVDGLTAMHRARSRTVEGFHDSNFGSSLQTLGFDVTLQISSTYFPPRSVPCLVVGLFFFICAWYSSGGIEVFVSIIPRNRAEARR